MQEVKKSLEWNGVTYPLVFNLNVMQSIQEEYESFKKWAELAENKEEVNIKALKFGIKESINEGLDIEGKESFITEKEVGRLLTDIGIAEANKKMQEIVIASNKTDNEPKNE